MDGTQTSEPTETGPGSPGQASAFRRALDEQAVSEGPLDLTTPLDFAEIRAALSNSGTLPAVRDNAAKSAPLPPRAPGSRQASRHAASKRLGKIAVFVAMAAALSVGTGCALVISSGSQGSSVSLPPTTGNIPVAPSGGSSQDGQISFSSGSTSVTAAAGLSHSPSPTASTASPSATATSASPSASASSSASPGQSGTSSASPSPSGTGASGSYGTNWVTLYWGIQSEQSEVSQVQSLLTSIGLLDSWHRHAYYNPQVNVQPDPTGSYGSATEDAVAVFQQNYGVNFTGQPGTCDLTTYNALVQAAG